MTDICEKDEIRSEVSVERNRRCRGDVKNKTSRGRLENSRIIDARDIYVENARSTFCYVCSYVVIYYDFWRFRDKSECPPNRGVARK